MAAVAAALNVSHDFGNVESADRTDQSEHLQHPNHYDREYNNIEQTFHTTCHGNESVDQPKDHADYNQSDNETYQGHTTTLRNNLLLEARQPLSLPAWSYRLSGTNP
jgi:hypothetical protein